MTGSAGLRMPRREPFRRPSPDASGRGRLVALFVAYLVLLAWIVLWKLEPPYVGEGELRHIKLVPFAPTAEDGASEPFEVIANVVLFVPFGLYLGLLAPSWMWWKVAGVVAGSSLLVESAQWVLSVGSCDITDVIANTAGSLAGLGMLVLARRRLRDRTDAIMMLVCSIVTVLFLLSAGIFLASPVHYAPLRDVDIRSSPVSIACMPRSIAHIDPVMLALGCTGPDADSSVASHKDDESKLMHVSTRGPRASDGMAKSQDRHHLTDIDICQSMRDSRCHEPLSDCSDHP